MEGLFIIPLPAVPYKVGLSSGRNAGNAGSWIFGTIIASVIK
jgi:hypothetical protein